MEKFCDSLTRYSRRETVAVQIGNTAIGGDNPIRIQSMTNTDTNDTAASVAQTERIAAAGGEIVRLTAQGRREAENLGAIRAELDRRGCRVPLVADIHFLPSAALVAAEHVEKIRINPGNFNDKGGQFDELLAICKRRGAALRIGVNHGSLAPAVMERYGDTPEGMVASAMEFLRRCRAAAFDRVVLSVKSSNVRVMVQAYRMLAAAMRAEEMRYPLHLGVTEAGNDREGRIKSAAGIGALLADGLGDTIRVSLTEAPEREIPVARMLADYFAGRENHAPIPAVDESLYSPYSYRKRPSEKIGGIGGDAQVAIWSEIPAAVRETLFEADIRTVDRIPRGRIVLLKTNNLNGIAEQRAALLTMAGRGLTNPVIIQRTYDESDPEVLQIKAAADLGPLFLDGFGDAIRIENFNPAIPQSEIDALSLDILQTARVRISKPEYIACPSCGRTLYNIEKTLAAIKARTGHLVGVKIGVMGCIVNGPGEMADADYGYVGSGPGRITLYKGREVVRRNIPEEQAIDEVANGTLIPPYFFCGSKTLNKTRSLRRAACFTLSTKDFILSGNCLQSSNSTHRSNLPISRHNSALKRRSLSRVESSSSINFDA